jgi:hypothetical protein
MVRQSAARRKREIRMSASQKVMTDPALEFDLRASIRTIENYPKPGVMFRDITTCSRGRG